MALFQDSGQSEPDRNAEATTLTRRIKEWMQADAANFDKLTPYERIFMTDKISRLDKFGSLRFIQPTQLFCLRDIWEKIGQL